MCESATAGHGGSGDNTALVGDQEIEFVDTAAIDLVGQNELTITSRLYSDPAFTILVANNTYVPQTTQRFYLEVGSKFAGNQMTLEDCAASTSYGALEVAMSDNKRLRDNTDGDVVPLITDYCKNNLFDVIDHSAPGTHLERVSFRKFKFLTQEEMYFRCRVKICTQKPCGVCTNNGNTLPSLPRALQEQEMSRVLSMATGRQLKGKEASDATSQIVMVKVDRTDSESSTISASGDAADAAAAATGMVRGTDSSSTTDGLRGKTETKIWPPSITSSSESANSDSTSDASTTTAPKGSMAAKREALPDTLTDDQIA